MDKSETALGQTLQLSQGLQTWQSVIERSLMASTECHPICR
jgi:hypothetical protein